MSLLDDLADVLSSGGVGTVGTTLYKGILPSTPDAALALFETGGPEPVRAMAPGLASAIAEQPHVQLLVRDLRAGNAKKTAQDAVRLLDWQSRTINGVAYYNVFALQSPFFFERDAAGRTVYAVNFEAIKALASSS